MSQYFGILGNDNTYDQWEYRGNYTLTLQNKMGIDTAFLEKDLISIKRYMCNALIIYVSAFYNIICEDDTKTIN